MNCTVVQILRKYGFAWGGNFLTPDGMHIEWVGERRDQLSYPSTLLPERARGDAIGHTEGRWGAGRAAARRRPPTDSRGLLLAETSLGDD